MPLYEGIGLISEKHAVVLDIGWDTTKCGYAGEVSPRCIVPSRVGAVSLHAVTNAEELYAVLVDFVHQLYFKWLLVNPKDRRVVIVENLLGSSLFKDTLAKVLFKHYEVSSVLFIPSHLVALFSLGVSTGLVLDVGHKEATVVPVYEGVPILAAWQAQPLAGEAVQAAVKADLVTRGRVTSSVLGESAARAGDAPELLTEALVRDIALRCCFVTNINRGRQLRELMEEQGGDAAPTTPPHLAPLVNYPISGSQFLQIDGITREGSSELLWRLDNDCISVASIILDSILASPVDCRRQLADSLVIIGGTSMMPGFRSRLNQELKSLLASARYQDSLKITSFKMFKPPGQANYTAWLGGAIFGATDAVVTRSLSREQYLKDPAVPDWANLRFNSVYNQERQG